MTPENRATINAELRGPLFVLLIVIPLLTLAGWRAQAGIGEASVLQREIREAQITRSRILRFQLDEETGVRGFTSTGDPLFLEPYNKAKAAMPIEFANLRRAFAPLAVDDIMGVVEAEEQTSELWDKTVALPLIADPDHSPHTDALQRRGKQMIDDIRNDDQKLLTLLDDAASDADVRSDAALSATLVFSIVAVGIVTLGAGLFGFLQARSSRAAFQNRLLFENQKRIADALQAAFLNPILPSLPSVGLHATYVPAAGEEEVGGDWYDAFELPDRRILFSIGDVAGHGLQAAVVMSRARQAIIAAGLHENDPAKVLERANASILLQEERMVTAICGFIDPATLEVVYSTAGHPAPVLAQADSPSIFLPSSGIPLGISEQTDYRTYLAHPAAGSLLVFYTDGVIEHKRDIVEGRASLLEATRLAALDDSPALAIQRNIFKATVPADDVAILTFTFKGQPGKGSAVTTVSGLQANRLEIAESSEALAGLDVDPHAGNVFGASPDALCKELVRSRC